MKKQSFAKTIKYITICVFFYFGFSNGVNSQFNLNDSNLIFKDKDGNLMIKDSVLSFMNKGKFGMMTKDLENGKTEITLIRKSVKVLDEEIRKKHKWIAEKMGKPFPEFLLTSLDGRKWNKAALIGKITVINFWFTGCKPCVAEIPQLNRLASTYNGVANFLAFSFDDKQKLNSFLAKNKFNYVQFAASIVLNKKLDVDFYPTHLILDKNGLIQEVVIGATDEIFEKLNGVIEKQLNH